MFTVFINQPGCLPEAEPVDFDTCAEAWAYVSDEIERDWENDDIFEESFIAQHKRAKRWSEVWQSALVEEVPGGRVAPNGYAYCVEVAE